MPLLVLTPGGVDIIHSRCLQNSTFKLMHVVVVVVVVVVWQLGSLRTFSAVHDHTHFYACKSPDQTSGHM